MQIIKKKEHHSFGSFWSIINDRKIFSFYFDEKKGEICWFQWFGCLLGFFFLLLTWLFCFLILVGWLFLFYLFVVGFGLLQFGIWGISSIAETKSFIYSWLLCIHCPLQVLMRLPFNPFHIRKDYSWPNCICFGQVI